MTHTIRSVLRGVKPGRMQSVGNMQVIPLILDMPEDNRFAPPDLYVSNRNYGQIDLSNQDTRPTIAPVGATYLTKQRAQDHAIMGAQFIKGKSRIRINDAACVQSTQGGMIQEEQTELQILPYSLREESIGLRGKQSHNKLWYAIGRFNRLAGCARGAQHLEYYTEVHNALMDQFVAEFEVLPNQIGAIILINGKVYGVERAPNTSYWRTVWKPLIRMCYGSQAIIENKTSKDPDRTPVSTSIGQNINSLQDLKEALEQADRAHYRAATRVIDKLLDNEFNIDDDEGCADFRHLTLNNDQFVGQIIVDGERVCYASLITKKDWHKNADWRAADEFTL